MTTSRMRCAVLSAVAALAVAAPAAAQQDVPDTGGRVYGLLGGGFGDGTFTATGAGAGLRLTPHIGLDLELTRLSGRGGEDTAAPWFGGIPAALSAVFNVGAGLEDHPPSVDGDFPFPFFRFEDPERDVTTLVTRFTVEFPIANGRLFPYLTGGGGVGRVTEHFRVVFPPIPWPLLGDDLLAGNAGVPETDDGAMRFFGSLTSSMPSKYSRLGLSLLLGGGVDVRVWRGLGVGVDVRWLRVLLDHDHIDTAQVASNVSYRF